MMGLNKTACYGLIFAIGVVIGLSVFSVPITSHWFLQSLHLSKTTSFANTLKPVLVPFPVLFYIFRPLSFILYKILFVLFGGMNHELFRAFFALVLGFFGLISFILLDRLFPKKRDIAFFSSILCVASPPVLVALWYLADADVLGTLFLLVAVLAFFKIERLKKLDKKALLYFAVFLVSSVISILLKETSRIFLFLIIAARVFARGKVKLHPKIKINLKAPEIYVLIALSALVIVFSLPTASSSLIEGFKLPLTTFHVSYISMHIMTQLFYSVFIGGAAALFVCSVIRLTKNETLGGFVGVVLVLFALSTTLITNFSYFGMVFFSANQPVTFVFSILLVLSLFFVYKAGDSLHRFLSLSILLVLFSAIGAIVFIPGIREDISSRAFIPVLPFIYFLVAESLFFLKERIKKSNGMNRFCLAVTLVFCMASIAFFFLAFMFNTVGVLQGYNSVELESKEFLAELGPDSRMMFFTDAVYPVYGLDMEMLYKNKTNASFMMLNPLRTGKNTSDLGEEICIKTQSLFPEPRPNTIHIYHIKDKAIVEDWLYPLLEGDFKWYEEKDTMMMLYPAGKKSNHWPWDYGLIRLHRKMIFSNQTFMEDFLKEKNATLLKSSSREYVSVPDWLEDTCFRLYKGIPLKIRHKITGSVYSINTSELRCNNWYPEETWNNITYSWMSQNATVSIYNPLNETKKVKIFARLWSLKKERNLEIYLNDDLVSDIEVAGWNIKEYTTPFVVLQPGENTLKFRSREGCSKPSELGLWEWDWRCLSFAFFNVTVLSKDDIRDRIIYAENWHNRENYGGIDFIWMSQNASLNIYKNSTERVKLNFIFSSLTKKSVLDVYLNGNFIGSYDVYSKFFNNIITPLLTLQPGDNELVFSVREGCKNPTELGLWENDTRCLSIQLFNITEMKEEELETIPLLYENNWYPEETWDNMTYRWMSQNGTISIFSPKGEKIKLNMTLRSISVLNEIEMYLNGVFIASYEIESKPKEISTPLVELLPGENKITLHSKEGCKSPTKLGLWENDTRCLSIQIFNISKIDEKYMMENPIIYENNWYPEEVYEGIDFRWMSQNATLLVYNKGKESEVNFTFTCWTVGEDKELEIYVGETLMKKINIKEEYSVETIPLILGPGVNIIRFYSAQDCVIPEEMGYWKNDRRCLRFAFRNFELETPD